MHNISPMPNRADWKSLYRAAMLETDRSLVPHRVSRAEEAIRERGREVFHQQASPEELEVLKDVLYALRAYRTAWEHTDAA